MIPSITTNPSFPFIIPTRGESPISIDIINSDELKVSILSPLKYFFSTKHMVQSRIFSIFHTDLVSNEFIESITSAHLEDEKLFKTPLLKILTELESRRAPDTQKDILCVFHFKLITDPIEDIKAFFNPRKTVPIRRPVRPWVPLRSGPYPISLLTGNLPFEISLKKIEDCLDKLTTWSRNDFLYQSEPFIYDAPPPPTAGAASASSEKTIFSESERLPSPFAVTKELMDFSIGYLITENPKQKPVYDTLVALSKQIAKSDFAPLSYPVSETRAIVGAGAASGGAGTDLISTKKTHLTQKSFPTSAYPLLNLEPDECAAIIGRNLPDIARSMLNGVFKSKKPKQASLIRTELFMNLLANYASEEDRKLHCDLIQALEEAILDLNDYEKAWARAKFISIAFLKFYQPSIDSLPYPKPTKIYEHVIKMDTKEAPLIESTDGKIKPITSNLYKKALQKITFHLNALSIIQPFIHSILRKEDLNWEKRKHLISSYYESRR